MCSMDALDVRRCPSVARAHNPHLWTPNPGFNPGLTPRICYIKGVVNPRLDPGFGVLRCGLSPLSRPHI
jgi:hypothetical protein